MKIISSAENVKFKEILNLVSSNKSRARTGLTLLDGIHLIDSYLKNVGLPKMILVNADYFHRTEIQEIAQRLPNNLIIILTNSLFKKLSSTTTPTGILAIISIPSIDPTLECSNSIWLDGIQDPGNLGSILRSAAATGIDIAYLSKNSVAAWSPKVLRAGMGAHFSLGIVEDVDFSELSNSYQGKVIGTVCHAPKTIFEADFSGNLALVFGNEGAGVSKPVLDLCHELVSIPLSGEIESLNVAATAAICLYERLRQIAA